MLARHLGTGMRLLTLSVALGSLAACSTTGSGKSVTKKSKEYFSEKEYGVAASQRVISSGPIPKGGGREMVGKPYVVKGQTFVPRVDTAYNKVGYASWYGSAFHGRYTSNGEIYDRFALTAAHPTLPLPSYARVTNLDNGSSVIVRINDRGPFERGRIIDLSSKTADLLDMKGHGTAKVRVQYVGRARLDGQDEAFLMASYVPKGSRLPASQVAPGVMVASADNSIPASALSNIPVPSAPPAQALALGTVAPQATPFDSISQVVIVLPEFGPVPAERPSLLQVAEKQGRGLAAGYVTEVADAQPAPFKAVMAEPYRLTADQIRRSYQLRD